MDLIQQYGADATRFGLLIQVQQDQQALRFDEQAVKTGRNVVNKLWNVARFLQAAGKRKGRSSSPTAFDRWILARSAAVTKEVTDALAAYRFGDAIRTLHAFLWDEFADWYIEALKVEGFATPKVGQDAFQTLLRLLHPFMPFVTEELWSTFGDKGFIMHAPWPKQLKTSPQIPKEIETFKKVVAELRSLRASLGIPDSKIPAVLHGDFAYLEKIPMLDEVLRHFARYENAKSMKDPVAVGGVHFWKEDLLEFPLENQMKVSQAELTKMKQEVDTLRGRIDKMTEAKAPADRIREQTATLEKKQADLKLKEASLKELQAILKTLQ